MHLHQRRDNRKKQEEITQERKPVTKRSQQQTTKKAIGYIAYFFSVSLRVEIPAFRHIFRIGGSCPSGPQSTVFLSSLSWGPRGTRGFGTAEAGTAGSRAHRCRNSECRAGVCRQGILQALSTWPTFVPSSRNGCRTKCSQLPRGPISDGFHLKKNQQNWAPN